MVEVFKTNVTNRDEANMLVNEIHRTFEGYIANFDLDDCDRILRVKCAAGAIKSGSLIRLLKFFGCQAEVLQDEILPMAAGRSTGIRFRGVMLQNNS
ncbi:MAG: hypothetical protein ACOYXT_27560 [Bacteroidota bacterium]